MCPRPFLWPLTSPTPGIPGPEREMTSTVVAQKQDVKHKPREREGHCPCSPSLEKTKQDTETKCCEVTK